MFSFIHDPKDFWAGLIYICFGSGIALVARDYSMGSAIRMGPGYFPTVLGALLVLIGIISVARGITNPGERLPPFAWRPVLFISLSLVLFGLLLLKAGLITALAALLVVAPLASRFAKLTLAQAIAGITLILFCVLVFVEALGLPLPLLGTWFG